VDKRDRRCGSGVSEGRKGVLDLPRCQLAELQSAELGELGAQLEVALVIAPVEQRAIAADGL